MKILPSAANGKTGRHVIASLRARTDVPLIRGLGTRPVEHADESFTGDMNDPTVRARAGQGVDAQTCRHGLLGRPPATFEAYVRRSLSPTPSGR